MFRNYTPDFRFSQYRKEYLGAPKFGFRLTFLAGYI